MAGRAGAAGHIGWYLCFTFVGFKSVSAYNRWWEARHAVEGIVIHSRAYLVHVRSFIDCMDLERREIAIKLLNRQLGWVFAVAHMLRKTSRLKTSDHLRLFKYRWAHKAAAMHRDPLSYGRFLDPEEFSAAQTYANPATYLLCQQADSIRELSRSGILNDTQEIMLARLLGTLAVRQGMCERIKNTPFPRQIASFATIFTWIFVLLLPLAFIDVFEVAAAREKLSHALTDDIAFMLLAPLAAVISWVFFMMERVSDSTEDPFEGGVHDVPLSALCRTIEIEFRQVMGEKDIPPPLEPVGDVLY
ncbi:MAG: bestrophin family ion channel [Xanthobacteraceae bacterium]